MLAMTPKENAADAERPLLSSSHIAPDAMREMAAFNSEIVAEVQRVVADSPVVVVGMAQNPHVKKVRKALKEAGVEFKYLEYGSYFSKWKERLAIKLWSGWPTFPQVFVRGVLIGGRAQTVAAIKDGSLSQSLSA